MRHLMTKEQFQSFKQKQWCSMFSIAITLIPFVTFQLALALALIGGFCLLRCSQWGLFD